MRCRVSQDFDIVASATTVMILEELLMHKQSCVVDPEASLFAIVSENIHQHR